MPIPLPPQLPGCSGMGILSPSAWDSHPSRCYSRERSSQCSHTAWRLCKGVLGSSSSALENFGSPGAFQVVSSAVSPSSPLHCILIDLHVWCSKEIFSSEKHFIRVWLVRFQWHFQMYFCASSLVKKKKILFPFWQLKVLLPDLNQPAEQGRRAVGRTCSITQSNDDQ